MATVVPNRTVKDMNTFFERNGNGQLSVRSNDEATHLWIEELARHGGASHDVQPLHLSPKMVRVVSRDRLTAPQVASEIFNFKELLNLFCGACCDKSNDTTRTMVDDSEWPEAAAALSASLTEPYPADDNRNALIEWEEAEHTVDAWPAEAVLSSETCPRASDKAVSDQSGQIAESSMIQGNRQQPGVEQINDEVTLRDVYPNEEEMMAGRASERAHASSRKSEGGLDAILEVPDMEAISNQVQCSGAPSRNSQHSFNAERNSTSAILPARGVRVVSLTYKWPHCAADGTSFANPESLNFPLPRRALCT